MNLTINGKKEQLENVQKLAELLRKLQIGEEEKGFAVAVNEEVIFKSAWQNTILKDADRIEIIRATQGG
jgi:sulfur carrier protein